MNEYFKNDALAEQVWKDKYKLKDETLDDFFERIASEFARLDNTANTAERVSDENYEELSQYGKDRLVYHNKKELFLSLFKDFKYIIPGGSVLAGVGTGKPVSLSNCFVTPTDDSIADIFNTARDMSQIYKRRGGNGTDLSLIRPAKAVVNNAAKTTGGVVPFMELYSQVTNTIGQDGRRGALMLSIDIRHPDSPQFITSKQDLSKITGANISVKIDDEFMNLVKADGDYILRWPCNSPIEHLNLSDYDYNHLYKFDIDNEYPTRYVKKIKAKELWDSIIKCAHATAEPGILFWDTILNNDPASVYPEFKAISTNPCGEIPLSAYDSCRLIAVNLYNLVNDKFTLNAKIDEKLAYKVFYEAQIIGDILVDLEVEHVQRIIDITDGDEKKLWMKIRDIGMKGRRTGVGITGYADMLAALGLPYGEKVTTDWIMNLKMKAELDASIDLAIINGAFPSYNKNLEYAENDDDLLPYNKFYEFILKTFPEQVERMHKYGRRNVSWSTINGGIIE